jgi:hypothetical protein
MDEVSALRFDLERERFARRLTDEALLDAITERDRLRAVVDAVRETASTVVGATNESPYEKGNAAAWGHVLHAVGQLDVSPNTGGTPDE